MIFSAPADVPKQSSRSSRFNAEDGESVGIYQAAAIPGEAQAFAFRTEFAECNMAPAAKSIELVEDFDWRKPKLNRDFIALEQKFLAEKASTDESKRYFAMKSDRDSAIFSKRYLEDYGEIERLKILSTKIAELQKYLRPIRME